MKPGTTTFAQLGLSAPLLRALTEKNYLHPSPIQAEAIPHLLAGRDILGSAQTGTGKTAAFALPILQRLSENQLPRTARSPRALILTPTRELAVQIGDSFSAYGKHLRLRHAVIYGGVGQRPQVEAAHVADIAIATPGRLLDLASQGHIRFDKVEVLVLDEADRMLDMGFAPDIKRIVGKLPTQRQSLLFSATMPSSILELAARVVRDPVRVAMTPETPTVDRIAQSVIHVQHGQKYPLLRELLGEHPQLRVLVFMRTKHGANKLARNLDRDGFAAEAIHGNKSQSARQRALEAFRAGEVHVLVATDVAARGIDVKEVALVINYDIPHEPEAYVHRIGRTARAGTEGRAISFCEPDDRHDLRSIERTIRKAIPVLKRSEFATPATQPPASQTPQTPPAASKPHHAAPAHGHATARTHSSEPHRPAPHRSTEHRSPSHRPTEHRPAQHRAPTRSAHPAEHRPMEHRPHSHAARPTEHRPTEHRPMEHRPRTEHAPRAHHAPRPTHHAARPTQHAPRPTTQAKQDHRPEAPDYSSRALSPRQRYQQRQRRGSFRSGWQP